MAIRPNPDMTLSDALALRDQSMKAMCDCQTQGKLLDACAYRAQIDSLDRIIARLGREKGIAQR